MSREVHVPFYERLGVQFPRPTHRREPYVEDMVEVDVRQERRHYSPNAKGNFQFERVVEGWREEPVLDLRRNK